MPGFDDSQLTPLVEREVPKPGQNEQWQWASLAERARGLGLPERVEGGWRKWIGGAGPPAHVFVRCVFSVDDQGFA